MWQFTAIFVSLLQDPQKKKTQRAQKLKKKLKESDCLSF